MGGFRISGGWVTRKHRVSPCVHRVRAPHSLRLGMLYCRSVIRLGPGPCSCGTRLGASPGWGWPQLAGWLAGWLGLAALRCGGNGCVAGRSSCWEAPLVLVLELELEPRLVLELEQGWSGLRSPSSGGSGVCWGRTCTGVTVGSGFWVGGSGRDGRFGFGCCGSPSILLLFACRSCCSCCAACTVRRASTALPTAPAPTTPRLVPLPPSPNASTQKQSTIYQNLHTFLAEMVSGQHAVSFRHDGRWGKVKEGNWGQEEVFLCVFSSLCCAENSVNESVACACSIGHTIDLPLRGDLLQSSQPTSGR